MGAGRRQSAIPARPEEGDGGADVQGELSEADGPGVAFHAGSALAIVFMAEATERSPRAPAPGLRLLIATAATFPVWNTAAIVATSSSMLRPFADGVEALGTNRGSRTSRSTWR